MAKKRCLKRAPGKTRCLRWAKVSSSKPRARKRSGGSTKRRSGGGSKAACVGAPFRMKTKAGIKCACVAKRKGTLVPKFVKMTKCNLPGTKVSDFKSERKMYIPMVKV